MKNEKYYCAWHPEKGLYSEAFADSEAGTYAKLIIKLRILRALNREEATVKACEEELLKLGWRVKEVVIVDADEFDKLTKEATDE